MPRLLLAGRWLLPVLTPYPHVQTHPLVFSSFAISLQPLSLNLPTPPNYLPLLFFIFLFFSSVSLFSFPPCPLAPLPLSLSFLFFFPFPPRSPTPPARAIFFFVYFCYFFSVRHISLTPSLNNVRRCGLSGALLWLSLWLWLWLWLLALGIPRFLLPAWLVPEVFTGIASAVTTIFELNLGYIPRCRNLRAVTELLDLTPNFSRHDIHHQLHVVCQRSLRQPAQQFRAAESIRCCQRS